MAKYLRIVLALPLLVAALIAATGAPASASCAGSPSPSPHMFKGTVVSTGSEGRIAQVVTDDGREVEVRGTPDASGVTSVDRTYRAGARYEFHPVNSGSPYEDNACTATRELSGPVRSDESAEVTPAGGGDDGQSVLGLPIVLALTMLAAAATTTVAVGIIRRRRSPQRHLAAGG